MKVFSTCLKYIFLFCPVFAFSAENIDLCSPDFSNQKGFIENFFSHSENIVQYKGQEGYIQFVEDYCGSLQMEEVFSSISETLSPEDMQSLSWKKYSGTVKQFQAEKELRQDRSRKSVWKVNVSKTGTATGFFISRNHFVTNFHVLRGALDHGKSLSDIFLSQKGRSQIVRVKSVLKVSALYDLALLEVSSPLDEHFNLRELPLKKGEVVFVSGYPRGIFAEMAGRGGLLNFEYFDAFYINYHSALPGSSGSPVFDRQGQVIGVLTEAAASGGGLIRAITLKDLKKFLKRDFISYCNDGFACVEEEMTNLKKLASGGNSRAQNTLGNMFRQGMGVEMDLTQAVYWYKQAAVQGDISAQGSLAVMYYLGEGVDRDIAQTIHWYKEAALQGISSAQYVLSSMYYEGDGVAQDSAQSFYWCREAAVQGHSSAQYNLSVMYYEGKGVEQDLTQAVYWNKEAAEQSHVQAQVSLGNFYFFEAAEEEKDFVWAAYWYKQAALRGDEYAQYMLGLMYYEGKGVEKNTFAANKWLQRAANRGHTMAQAALRFIQNL